MTHPILVLQSGLVAALRADAGLTALTGTPAVFDAPPETEPPYVVIARHDLVPRAGDDAPGHEHRVLVHVWAREPSRKAVLALCDRVTAVALGASFAGLAVTFRALDRTDTAIDLDSGRARAALTFRFFSEPL